MSLHFSLTKVMPCQVHEMCVTHNLAAMAKAAGIYEALWRASESGYTLASQIVEPLRAGLALLRARPSLFRQYDPPNGWGSYDGLVKCVEELLAACEEHPDAEISSHR